MIEYEIYKQKTAYEEKIRHLELEVERVMDLYNKAKKYETERFEFLDKIANYEKQLEDAEKRRKAEMSRLELEKIYAIKKIRNSLKIKWKRTKDSLLNLKKDQLDTTTRLSLL